MKLLNARRDGSRSLRALCGVGVTTVALVVAATGVAAADGAQPTPTIASKVLSSDPHLSEQGQVAFDGKNYWVANYEDDNIVAVSPTTGAVVRTIEDYTNFDYPWGIAYASGKLYVCNYSNDVLDVISVQTGLSLHTVNTGSDCYSVLYADGYVWTANEGSSTVTRINPTTYDTAIITMPETHPVSLAYGGGLIWVATSTTSLVSINPATGTVVRTVPIALNNYGVAFAGGKVWVAGTKPTAPSVRPRLRTRVNTAAGEVASFSPTTYVAGTSVSLGVEPYAITFDGSDLWVSDYYAPRTYALSPTTGAVLGNAVTGSEPYFSSVGLQQLIVSNYGDSTLSEIALTSPTSSVLFSDGLSSVPAGSPTAKSVAAIAKTIAAGAYASVVVTGYSDKQGSAAQNHALAAARAAAVTKALTADLAALHVTGVTIVAKNGGVLTTYANQALDRRADITATR